jgi:hypothetical protein
MPELRNNRKVSSTLNNKRYGNQYNVNLKTFKKKLYENRTPNKINKYISQEADPNNNTYVGVARTNFITCPNCSDLLDIRHNLDTREQYIKCGKCGLNDIDLYVECKKHNKLELLQSSGFPVGQLFQMDKTKISDQLVRPSNIHKKYERDMDTGVMKRTVENNTVYSSTVAKSKSRHKNIDFVNEYENEMSDVQKEILKPIKRLVDTANIQITNIIDVNL